MKHTLRQVCVGIYKYIIISYQLGNNFSRLTFIMFYKLYFMLENSWFCFLKMTVYDQ